MKKVLLFDCDIPIKTYSYFIDYLGVLKANGYEIDDIVESCFLFLDFIPFTGQVNFQHKDRLKYFMKPKDFNVKKIGNVLSFVKENIVKNNYIVIFLNDNYFNIKLKQTTGVHNWLIYGFDDEKEEIYIAGYIFDRNCGEYKTLKISYCELQNSIVENLTLIEKNRISANHIFSIPDDIQTQTKNRCRCIKKLKFNVISLNVFVLLILHNYIFSRIKIRPYKRCFLDLRDLRIIYEQTYAFKKVLLNKNYGEYQAVLDELTNLSEAILMEASVFHYQSNGRSKTECVVSINKKLYKIYKIEKALSKIIFS